MEFLETSIPANISSDVSNVIRSLQSALRESMPTNIEWIERTYSFGFDPESFAD